jgi:hypothetical protein
LNISSELEVKREDNGRLEDQSPASSLNVNKILLPILFVSRGSCFTRLAVGSRFALSPTVVSECPLSPRNSELIQEPICSREMPPVDWLCCVLHVLWTFCTVVSLA